MIGADQLDRYDAADAPIRCLENSPHSTGAELFQKLVRGELALFHSV
jgi:hypothetical protein